MLGRDGTILEGGADLAGRLSIPDMASLDINGDRAHDDQQEDSAENNPLDGDRFAPGERKAAFGADERGVVGDRDDLIAVREEATGEIGASASAGHNEDSSKAGAGDQRWR